MNAHELTKLIALVDEIDFEDLEDDEAIELLKTISPTTIAEIVAGLEELQARRKAARDEHGIEVPS